MSSQSVNTGRLSTIDLLFSVMDSARRPLDFALVFHFKEAPSLESLRAGARSARNLYPTTGSYIDKKEWVRFIEPGDGLTALSASSSESVTAVIEEFLDRPLEPGSQLPVQQLAIKNDSGTDVKLVTRFHHAVGDGLSAAMWLGHQLRVAYGNEAPVAAAAPFQDLCLRSHPAAVKRSRYAYRGPSHRLSAPRAQHTHTRRWHTIEVAATDLRKLCHRTGGFTYNDLLATSALEVFTRWNRMHCNGRRQKVGLWLPVNIRQHSSEGFGNGTSRIRLYARYAEGASLIEKCREIRHQVSWSSQHGEWAVPDKSPFTYLPLWASAPLLRGYLNRPWVDMATGVFSHAERWTGADGEIFQNAEKIESIGQLHSRYPVAINGATLHGKTWLTFTYDPGLLSSDDIQRLVLMYQEQIDLAWRELK